MDIVKFPNPVLFKKCEKVTVFDNELKFLLESMFETMKAHNGVGLAANQVGISYRMFVMESPKGEKLFLVNPRIVDRSKFAANLREGCLSAPGEFLVLAERTSWVKVECQNETGQKKSFIFQDLYSVCAQHEIDHLDGKSHLQSPSIPKQKRKELSKRWGLR